MKVVNTDFLDEVVVRQSRCELRLAISAALLNVFIFECHEFLLSRGLKHQLSNCACGIDGCDEVPESSLGPLAAARRL